MLELYLIRHPKTMGDHNLIKGQLDIGLEPGWEAETDAIAGELASKGAFDAFFSSDLQRSRLPAERIAAYLRNGQKKPLQFAPMKLLRERNMGLLEGKTHNEVKEKDAGIYLFEMEQAPEGELKSDIIKRAESFATGHLRKFDNGRIGIVGHGWWINHLMRLLLNDNERPYYPMKNLEVVCLMI